MTDENLLTTCLRKIEENSRLTNDSCIEYGAYTSRARSMIYDDSRKCYYVKNTENSKRTVRSAKAFTDCIKEELRRRNNSTGKNATVRIHLGGGYFIADDDFNEGHVGYDRLNSQQWNTVKNGINKEYSHREFLDFVSRLKPSIVNFQNLFRSLVSLKIIGKSELSSNPIFTEDGMNTGYTCTYKLADGTDGEEVLPAGFAVELPFAKAGERKYMFDIELLFTKDDFDNIRIVVLCPDFENVEETAILDESENIKDSLSELKELLVLADF